MTLFLRNLFMDQAHTGGALADLMFNTDIQLGVIKPISAFYLLIRCLKDYSQEQRSNKT